MPQFEAELEAASEADFCADLEVDNFEADWQLETDQHFDVGHRQHLEADFVHRWQLEADFDQLEAALCQYSEADLPQVDLVAGLSIWQHF